MNNTRRPMLILLLFLAFRGYSQNFVWNKVYGGPNGDYILDICNGGSGKCIYLAGYITGVKGPAGGASVQLGNITLSSSRQAFTFIMKTDTSGKVIWARKIFDGKTVFCRMSSDRSDNLYFAASLSRDSARVYPGTPLINTLMPIRSNSFIVKLDPAGDFDWQRVFDNSGSILGKITIAQDKLLACLGTPNGQYILEGDTVVNAAQAFVLLDTNNRFQYMRQTAKIVNLSSRKGRCQIQQYTVHGDSIHAVAYVVDSVYLGNQLYVFPNIGRTSAGTTIRLTYALNSGILGSIQQLTSFLRSSPFLMRIHYFSKTMYCIEGHFTDTLQLKGFKTVVRTGASNAFYYAYYQNNLPYRLITFEPGGNWSGNIYSSIVNHGFLYASGWIQGDVEIDGFKTTDSQGTSAFMKMDSIGNVMWIVRAENYPSQVGFAFDDSRSAYLGTYFTKRMVMNNASYFAKDSGVDFLVSKIYDFSITRGQVSKGPYCAGDTFAIPYTKDGRFDSTNVFIAQLSDEHGEFNGGHRELGRLEAFKDSTIQAVLPLFDVASSPDYRIRIISTRPPVQSYYRLDSLRLLIYSKDTANAGTDTTVCYGSKLQIKTSGGSRWRWSPGHMVADSTRRITLTKPILSPTRFRIIISDSSGCGKTDTAYKWVYPAPKLTVLGKDTTVCRGKASILAAGSGGLPQQYPYLYHWLDGHKTYLSNTGSLQYADTMASQLMVTITDGCSIPGDTISIKVTRYDSLKVHAIDTSFCGKMPLVLRAGAKGGRGTYSYTWYNSNGTVNNQSDSLVVKLAGSFNYGLQVKDHCTYPEDSVPVRIRTYVPLAFYIPGDSILCYGSTATISPVITSGQKKGLYRFTRQINNMMDTFVSSSLSKPYVYTALVKVSAVDMCGGTVSDSLSYNVLPPLKIKGVADTSLCAGQAFRLKVESTGGKMPLIRWKDQSGMLIKESNRIDTVLTPSATAFSFTASDNCTVPGASAQMRISMFPPLQAKLTAQPACYRDTVSLHAKISGGKPGPYQVRWSKQQAIVGNDTSLVYKTGNLLQTLYFSLSDQCSSPLWDSLVLSPMAIARMHADKTVQCIRDNRFIITNLTDSGRENISFEEIYFGDGADASELSPRRHLVRFRDTGMFKLKMVVKSNADMCIDSTSVAVQVKPVPVIDVSWMRSTLSYDYSRWSFKAKADQQMKAYTWYIDQFPPQAGQSVEQEFHYTGNVKIRVVGESMLGCFTDTTVAFDLLHRLRFYVPNMVTANHDGINEGFSIPGQEYMKEYRLQIFNRWGEKVFDSSDPGEQWVPGFDGNNVYVFKAEILDVYNERHKLNGTFGVIR